jgi:HEAT repeat protein
MYNDNPWAHPNEFAAAIISGDPGFLRGMAWALTMRLMPVMARSSAGSLTKRPANPVDFDTYVLALLNTKYASLVIPGYRQRLEDPHLLKDSLKTLAASEIHFESADSTVQEDDTLGLAKVKAAPTVKTTPLIRRNVCLALSGNKDPQVVETLLTVLAVDEVVMVREAAAQSLGAWPGKEKVAESLDKATLTDKEPVVRLAAFQSLAKVKALDEERVKRALGDASADVKSFAFTWLSEQKGAGDAVRSLVRAAMDGQDEALRVQALQIAKSVFTTGSEVESPVGKALGAKLACERLAAVELVRHFRLNGLSGQVQPLLADGDGKVRSAAVSVVLSLAPEALGTVMDKLKDDSEPGVLEQIAKAIGSQGGKAHKDYLEKLLQSEFESVRHAASDAIYWVSADDRRTMTRSMLVDPVMRVNFAAVRLIKRLKDESLYGDLVWATERHGNEYVRTRALKALDEMNHPAVHDLPMKLLKSPYWVVRLHAADILTRRATAADRDGLRQALESNQERWLKLTLEDAFCRSEGKPIPERTRLRLGKREHLEGGELPNGWQLWQGYIPENPAEARKLVDEGYRFGRVLGAPPNSALWTMAVWEDTKGTMNAYLLHFRNSMEQLAVPAPFLNHIMLFDEPHGLFGGSAADNLRAFLLEYGRPDLLGVSERRRNLPPELQRPYQYWATKTLGELSNFIVGLCRMTLGRQYPDIRWFPQTMTHYGGATADAFDTLDADGDYAWRYDNDNLMGHYSITAVMRAIHPGQPQCMVTWMGWLHPAAFTLDRVFTDTKYPDGPWRPRHYMGTRAALALYAGGVEAGFFNHVGYDPMSARGKDIGGLATFPLTPFSKALTDVIRNRMLGGDSAFWQRRYKEIEGEVMAERKPAKAEGALEDKEKDAEEQETEDFLDEAEGKKRVTIQDIAKEKHEAEREKHFLNAMIGCSWMNIFNCDVTRAMSNLPRPDNSPRDTLVILPRGTNWNGDAPTFVVPALALAAGFDLCPTYDCVRLTDLMRYDTILLLDGEDGVTSALVSKVNQWLAARKGGLLYVCGDLNTKGALFPELTFDRLEEKFAWEGQVAAVPVPKAEEEVTDKEGRKTGEKRLVTARMAEFQVAGQEKALKDESARLRFTWEGDVQPLIRQGGKAVLARWNTPPEVKSVVLFDGTTEAGPVYTEALEGIILRLDQERGSKIKRNRHWGHVIWENEGFVIDVATSGYRALQAARPREHRGVDIVTGVINPKVQHNECALILKDYVGPYAGGKGDWAVMAASELKEMTIVNDRTLRVQSRGVTRVTHIGESAIALANADGFEQVENQLYVWERMWKDKKAFSLAKVEGGWELHFSSDEPVDVLVDEK